MGQKSKRRQCGYAVRASAGRKIGNAVANPLQSLITDVQEFRLRRNAFIAIGRSSDRVVICAQLSDMAGQSACCNTRIVKASDKPRNNHSTFPSKQ